MIDKINLLKNVGKFASVSSGNSLPLERLTLIYAENGRGKTTLAAILRSLATGEPTPIIERRRFGAQTPPHVVIQLSNARNLVFQAGKWNAQLPDLVIFDDTFVDRNVCSGLAVDVSHRKNLHELVLGIRGVELSQRLGLLVERIQEHNKSLRYKGGLIPATARGGLTVDSLCALPNRPHMDAEIQEKERMLAAIQEQAAVLTKPHFDGISLPTFDVATIAGILQKGLPDLDAEAANRVSRHIAELGRGGEKWISDGVELLPPPGSDGTCPFCAQNLGGSSLITHYRAYFSQAYENLKRRITRLLSEVTAICDGSTQANFERSVRVSVERRYFWSKFCDISEIAIDTASIVSDWIAAGQAITNLLNAKQAAPLEQILLDRKTRNALEVYAMHRRRVSLINEEIIASNQKIHQVKEKVKAGNLEVIENELSYLRATESRFSPDIAPLCEGYLAEKSAKAATEDERDQVKIELRKYRRRVFPKYRDGVNKYLEKFNTGFRLETLTSRDSSGGPTGNYDLEINNALVRVAGGRPRPGKPSFSNTLSAGDRSTIALAFFLESLDQHYSIGDTIVVIDDPISSLDEHRSWATEREVRRLVDSAGQVIVLSHNKQFLCRMWEAVDRESRVALEIVRDSNG